MNKKSGRREAELLIQYQGYMKLARGSGKVSLIEARLVRQGDEFAWSYGLEPVLEHTPGPSDKDEEITHVYAIARLTDGHTLFEVMTRKQVDSIRARSRAANSGPWVTDYGEMTRKTVVKRLCKYLPKTEELARAIELDNSIESGKPYPVPEVDIFEVEAAAQEPVKTKSDKLAEKLGSEEESQRDEGPAPASSKPKQPRLGQTKQGYIDRILKLKPEFKYRSQTIEQLREIYEEAKMEAWPSAQEAVSKPPIQASEAMETGSGTHPPETQPEGSQAQIQQTFNEESEKAELIAFVNEAPISDEDKLRAIINAPGCGALTQGMLKVAFDNPDVLDLEQLYAVRGYINRLVDGGTEKGE